MVMLDQRHDAALSERAMLDSLYAHMLSILNLEALLRDGRIVVHEEVA